MEADESQKALLHLQPDVRKWSASYNRTLLQTLNDEVVIELLPAVAYLALLMVTGFVGNIFVIYIFGWKLRYTTQNFLFVWMAVFDVISCSVGMPSEIVDIRLYFLYENEVACKVRHCDEIV
jgi:hypothetical protein